MDVYEAILRMAERFGVPVVLLAVCIWLAREAAISLHSTVLEPVVASHVEFLEATQQTLREIGHTQDRQAETLRELATGQRELQQALSKCPRTEGTN